MRRRCNMVRAPASHGGQASPIRCVPHAILVIGAILAAPAGFAPSQRTQAAAPRVPVVRKLMSAGEVKPGEPFSKEVKIPLAREWNPEHLHVVVFLEGHSSHEILGATTSPAISR